MCEKPNREAGRDATDKCDLIIWVLMCQTLRYEQKAKRARTGCEWEEVK